MSAIQALMERELGRTALELLGEQAMAELLVPAAEQRALKMIQAIQTVLDDSARSDFECVEEIVNILERAGIPVSWHDFG